MSDVDDLEAALEKALAETDVGAHLDAMRMFDVGCALFVAALLLGAVAVGMFG